VFLSKIWFFLLAVAAAVALAIALVLPLPAGREVLSSEDTRLSRARRDVELLLSINARERIDDALTYARNEIYNELRKVRDERLASREADAPISQIVHDSAQRSLDAMLTQTKGDDKPEFLIALDAWGRVVARAGVDAKEWGDDLSGYFLVRDALRGYLRDDLWLLGGKLYRMAGAPVIAGNDYVGAILVGQEADEALAHALEERVSDECTGEGAGCDTHIAFFARGEAIANSGPTTVPTDIKKEVVEGRATLDAKKDEQGNVILPAPFTLQGETTSYRVVVKRLPGEVGAQDGFYAVFAERPRTVGFSGTLKSLSKGDLGKSFPWTSLALLLVAVLAVGLGLMWWETDRPLKRLLRESLALGKGDLKLFPEDHHRGKFGSIARSVNLALEKLGRDAKARRQGSGEVSAFSEDDIPEIRPLPASPPLGASLMPFTPPPPSDLSLSPPPVPPLMPPPKPARMSTSSPPPPPVQAPLDDDILGGKIETPASDSNSAGVVAEPLKGDVSESTEERYFRQVYDDFVELKKKCGESLEGLTYEKFGGKLRQNREQLVAKYNCKAVKFQVYVKDGKAALKATPVKA
jgi:hypothetical protein